MDYWNRQNPVKMDALNNMNPNLVTHRWMGAVRVDGAVSTQQAKMRNGHKLLVLLDGKTLVFHL